MMEVDDDDPMSMLSGFCDRCELRLDQILMTVNSRITRAVQIVRPTTHLGRSVPTTPKMVR